MIEKILGIAFLLSVIIREFFGINFDGLLFISGTSLAITYLVANWWITKPNENNFRTIAITLLYGIASASLTFSLIFQLLFYPGSDLLSIISIVFLVITIGTDFISSYNKERVLGRRAIWRFGILTGLLVIYYVVPQNDRIQFTYRGHPDFLEYYRNSKSEMDFVVIKDDYFKNHKGKMSMKDKYLALDTTYTAKEVFNDSVCQIALDSANRRFKKGKFELYAFLPYDSSGTPIHLLQKKFRLRIVAFANSDFVFKFCFNDAMIEAFERHYQFNPIDSIKITYDSLLNLGQTQNNAIFPGGFNKFQKYMICNLEFPEGRNLSPPYPTVRVGFRVSPTGYPDEIQITKSHSSKYDSAVLRLVRAMPRWTPGQSDFGTYEKHYVQETCTFDPTKQERHCR